MSIDAEFRELWLASGRATDVFEFLRTRRGLDPAQWLAVLHTHQQYLWRTDQPLAVEDYLTALSGIPGLPQEVDWRLQLVIGEFEARRQTDRPLSDDELSNRFPDLSETLRERLQAASSIAEELNENEAKPQTPDAPTSFESRATLPIGINSIIGKLQNGHQQQGRYRLDRILGEGAFGCVYLAYDQDLHRQVAVKVPAKGRFQCPEDAEMYLAEARIVASLDHPHIVSVYDMGRADDGSVYVVSRFIEGTTLAAIIEEKSATHRDAAAMLATVAKALHYAHEKRFIHRDIKPANILIDGNSGTPFVADFGLAIREDDYLRQHTLAGTPAYMSPEQARGEGHRLDGRSDIFALGVMLYELLTGKKPFDGTSIEATLDAVISHSPAALRELDGTIAPELERICLKALSKRASDRYATAAAMAEDLEAWLQPQPEIVPPKTDRQIVPRGLRSFGPDDADFFLDLLPGPRNRAGLPESIAFWKQRLEQTDPEQTFSVGLLYGPSGCGKSSLVKAGLIPHLSPDVITIYLEATPEETESRLLRQLRARLPELSVDLGLAETAERIRRTDGCKVVMIVDQFEQWLHAHRVDEAADLIRSLRHCDGSRLQAVLMIRDDFYLAAARLMNHIDVPIVTDQNFKLVDLFDLEHARRVLIRFGAAYNRLPAGTTGQLPDQSSALSAEQSTFVSAVVDGLAESGKVVSVRLSLLADMLKGRDWVPATLASIGGLSGIGVSFLEETFASIRSDARHRSHQLAVRGVLRALLPEVGTDIKGSMRSEEALLAASGYADRPHAFHELLRILDSELRLLTPTDADGQATTPQPRYYQLTHDYLVPSLREWLTRKQRETKQGRAELRLAERAEVWSVKPENRNLPTLWEWLTIRRLTDNKKWKLHEQTVMRRAGRVHAWRTGLFAATLSLVTLGGIQFNSHLKNQQLDLQATNLVDSLTQADFANLGSILTALEPLRDRATDELTAAFEAQIEGSDGQLKLAIGLMADDPKMLEIASRRLLDIPSAKFAPIRDLLLPYKDQITPGFWELAVDAQQPNATRFQAASALATFDPSAAQWDDTEFTSLLTEHLVGVLPSDLPVWQQALLPVREKLVPGLAEIFRDTNRREQERSFATDTLKTYAAGDAMTLASLICDADTDGFNTLFPVLAAEGPNANERLTDVLKQSLTHDWQDAPFDPSWPQLGATAKATLETHGGLLETRFALVQTLPWDRFSELATELSKSGYRPTRVRPYERDGETLVAAVWQRDGGRWELQQDLSLADLPDAQQPAIRDGLLPCDLAVQLVDDQGKPRFSLLWSQGNDEVELRRVVADLTAERFSEFGVSEGFYTSPIAGFPAQSTVTVWTDAEGTRHYGGIWSNQGAVAEINLGFDGEEYFDQPQWDIALGEEPAVTNPLVIQQAIVEQIDGTPTQENENPQRIFDRAIALFHLGDVDACKQQLDALLASETNKANPDLHRLHAWTLARLGDSDAARESLAKHLETVSDPIMRAYAAAPLEAYLGNHEAAKQQLSDATATATGDADQLYNVACAAALSSLPASSQVSSQVSSQSDESATTDADTTPAEEPATEKASSEEQRAEYRELALTLLEQTIAAGYDNGVQMATDIDLAALHDGEKLQQIVESLLPSRRVVGVWRSDVEYESRLIQAPSVDVLLEQVNPLIAAGYRPFSLVIDAEDSFLTLHRPLIPDAEKEQLAIRQASTAAALLRMGQAAQVWPLFQHANDLRVRSYLLSRLTSSQVDPALILGRLQNESDPASRHALILAVGQYAAADLLAAEQRLTALQWLKTAYADDPDPGVHGASEWALRQLGARDSIDEIRTAYATGKPVGERRWYLTQTASPSEQTDPPESQRVQPLAMALIDGTEPFLMGTPVSEAERNSGPTGKNEVRHLRKIGYRYAIGMHEVSVAQFKQFRPRHESDRTYARESDAPANDISWYDAAEYCNWLSEQEGIPRDQWCYDPDQPIAEGMVLPADHLQRIGYRLATEAEWEHACRAGTSTSRFYGETEGLLGEYGWYTKNSGDRNMLSVGAQKPNPLGLFGLQGNATEWCLDRAVLYDKDRLGNSVNFGKVDNSSYCVLRGGSFDNSASNLRSGHRNFGRPDFRVSDLGFRLSRTYP